MSLPPLINGHFVQKQTEGVSVTPQQLAVIMAYDAACAQLAFAAKQLSEGVGFKDDGVYLAAMSLDIGKRKEELMVEWRALACMETTTWCTKSAFQGKPKMFYGRVSLPASLPSML